MSYWISHFVSKYFYFPLIQDSGYNLYNTLVYAIFLALVLIFLVPFILKKLKIKVDSRFILGILPYLILGSVLRSSEDVGLFKSIWLISPLIWIIGFLFGFATLLISLFLEKKFKIKYYISWASFGTLSFTVLLFFFKFINWQAFLIVLGITAFWALLIYFTFKKFKWNKWAGFVIGSHLFDATVTFTAIKFFSFWEKHVLPSYLIHRTGPVIMFPLKLIVLIPVIYCIIKYVEKENQLYYLLVVGSFGIITGVRDLITLLTV